VRAAVVISASAVALSGCANNMTPSAATGATSVAVPAHAVASAVPRQALPAGVIGTGTFVSTNGGASGTITITSTGHPNAQGFDLLDVAITDYRSTAATPLQLYVSPYPPGTKCIADQYAQSLGTLGRQTTQHVQLPVSADPTLGDLVKGDPTLYRTIIVGSPETAPTTGGCTIIAHAEAAVKWTIPHRTNVLAMHDTGVTADASGGVTESAGAPAKYVTGGNDSISGVARRLGTTVGVLLYLDPTADLPNPWSRLPAGKAITLIDGDSR
jgi:hypothetical protein